MKVHPILNFFRDGIFSDQNCLRNVSYILKEKFIMSANQKDRNELALLINEAQNIEAQAYFDMFAAAPADYVREHGLRTEQFSGVTCFAHRDLPISLFNRALGLGASTPATEQTLNAVQEWMRMHANANFNIGVDINAQPAQLIEWLALSGLQPSGGGIARFWRTASQSVKPVKSNLTVRNVGANERQQAGELIRDAFGFPTSFDRWLGQLAGRENWQVYFACDGETPVAVGAMYLKDHVAWLGVGATLKEYRGRGAQSLLLNQRINDAIGMGARGLHVETGHPAEAESIGPSYRNILRAGFETLFVRQQFMPIKPDK